jgi:hypothetical protein
MYTNIYNEHQVGICSGKFPQLEPSLWDACM